MVWEPPSRLVFTWHPGRTPDTDQEVEVNFLSDAGGTEVTLTHTGCERLGDQAQSEREGYARGWEFVLRKYVEGAAVESGRWDSEGL